MQTLKRLSIMLPICAVLIAGTGCGDDSDNRATVDTGTLQPGNYRTTPRSPDEVRTPKNIDIQEALRLGAAVPMILETNPRLVFNRVNLVGKIFTQKHPPKSNKVDFSTQVPGFIAGWETVGQRRKESTQGRTVELTVLRFAEPQQAEHAAKFLSDAALRGDYPPVGTIPVPGYPTAFGQVGEYGSISVWLAQGAFVLEAWVGAGVDIPPDHAALAELVKSVFDKQLTALQSFEPTPPDRLNELPVDRDGLIQYALAGAEPTEEAAMSPAVALNFLQRPDLARRAFEDARVDQVVHGATQIYRAGDPDSAERLKAYFVSQLDPALQPVDSPPGLPAAHCTDDPESTGSLSCLFTVGRYTVIVEGSSQIQDLHQQTAAQYLLLEQAP